MNSCKVVQQTLMIFDVWHIMALWKPIKEKSETTHKFLSNMAWEHCTELLIYAVYWAKTAKAIGDEKIGVRGISGSWHMVMTVWTEVVSPQTGNAGVCGFLLNSFSGVSHSENLSVEADFCFNRFCAGGERRRLSVGMAIIGGLPQAWRWDRME